MKKIKLNKGDRVLAVVPEYCAGPGWSNQIVNVYIETIAGKLRTEYLQPDEMSNEMHTLFGPGACMCAALKEALK